MIPFPRTFTRNLEQKEDLARYRENADGEREVCEITGKYSLKMDSEDISSTEYKISASMTMV